jgi:hypothetical protein
MTFQTDHGKTAPPAFEEIESLAGELVEFTCSRTSDGFYRKAIRVLGTELVRQAMSEVRGRDTEPGAKPIEDRAKYLTSVLKNWMNERALAQNTPEVHESVALSASTFSLLDHRLDSSIKSATDELKTLDVPFSPDLIQWLLFVGPEYFTLTNEKAESDLVAATKIEIRGNVYEVPMLRGKLGRNDSSRGILTSEHMRVKGAIERIWADQRGPHGVEGGRCVVNAPVTEIARYMGIGTSGREYARIAEKVRDLGGTGYCYLLRENPELRALGLEDLSFQFFGETQSLTLNQGGKKVTHFQIVFSKAYSAALLSRSKVLVSRPPDMLKIRGDIALKLYVYLYPRLMGLEEVSIELRRLIRALDLRIAGWHQYKSQRKREFEKALREINGRRSTDGRVFSLQIEQGLNRDDFMLVAHLAR